jgi:hypothetical protein
MTKRRGLYFSRVIGTKVWPKDPVPPVIRIDEFVNIFCSLFNKFCDL